MNRTVPLSLKNHLSRATRDALTNHAGELTSVGVDVVRVARIDRAIGRGSFATHVFTPRESAYARAKARPAESFAGMFAAKEAVYKAFGLKWDRGFSWKWIEIVHDDTGAPSVAFARPLVEAWPVLRSRSAAVSISHTAKVAVAVAVA